MSELGGLTLRGCHPHPTVAPSEAHGSMHARAARVMPTVDVLQYFRFMRFVERLCEHLFPDRLSSVTDVTFDTWLAQLKFPQKHKDELRDIFEQQLTEPILIKKLQMWFDKRSKIDAFVKDETYEEYKIERMIYARCNASKVMLGPIVKAIEHEVYQQPAFIKHVPVKDRAKYICDMLEESGEDYIVTDYSKFESGFTTANIYACEYKLYEHMLREVDGGTKFLALIRAWVMNWNLVSVSASNSPDSSFAFLAAILGRRMSGEMFTSLGNGFRNFCNFMFFCLLNKYGPNVDGWDLSDVGTLFRMVVEGDDGAGRCPQEYRPTAAQFASLGWEIKLEVVESISEASFCGNVFAPEDMINVTDPIKVLIRTPWGKADLNKATRKTRHAYLRAKAYSLAYEYSGCPIVSAYANYLLLITAGVDPRKAASLEKNADHRRVSQTEAIEYYERMQDVVRATGVPVVPVGNATRYLVERLYGISVEEQVRAESELGRPNPDLSFLQAHVPDHAVHYFEHYVHPSHLADTNGYQMDVRGVPRQWFADNDPSTFDGC